MATSAAAQGMDMVDGVGGGGLTRKRGGSRQALGDISASHENVMFITSSLRSSVERGNLSVCSSFRPLSSRSREFVSAAKSDMIAADRPPLCKAEYVHCDGSAMRLKDTIPCPGTYVIAF